MRSADFQHGGLPLMAALLLSAHVLLAAPIYTVVDLGTLGGDASAYAINTLGQAVGAAMTPGGSQMAFATGGGSLGGLFPGGAYGINSAGQIAGTTYVDGQARATLWSHGRATLLAGPGSYGLAINAQGIVAGGLSSSDGALHAFTYSNGNLRDLGTLPGGDWSVAYGVNSAGVVAGSGEIQPGVFRAFVADGSGPTELGTLGGADSYAMAINDAGAVVGNSTVGSGYAHAFLYLGGQFQDLGTLGGSASYAYGISGSGQVVGYSWTAGDGGTHAFAWVGGVLVDLNALIPSASGWDLTGAYGINDSGQIVGSGVLGGQVRAFRLDPLVTPEPGVAVLIISGGVLLALAGWRCGEMNYEH